jgi:hypothetical protein
LLVVELLALPGVLRAFDRAASMGVKVFGASVSDFDTAVRACRSGRYKYLQFPFSESNRSFAPIFEILAARDMNTIVLNNIKAFEKEIIRCG